MFDMLYELVLYDLLQYVPEQSYQLLNHEMLALVITTVLMLVIVYAIFKIAVLLISLPFRWLS